MPVPRDAFPDDPEGETGEGELRHVFIEAGGGAGLGAFVHGFSISICSGR